MISADLSRLQHILSRSTVIAYFPAFMMRDGQGTEHLSPKRFGQGNIKNIGIIGSAHELNIFRVTALAEVLMSDVSCTMSVKNESELIFVLLPTLQTSRKMRTS